MSNTTGTETAATLLGRTWSWALGAWFAVQLVALVVAICWFWPQVLPTPATGNTGQSPIAGSFPAPPAPASVGALVAADLVDGGKKVLALLKQPAEGLPKYVLAIPPSEEFSKSVTELGPAVAPPAALQTELLRRLNTALNDAQLSAKADPALVKKVADPKDPQPKGEALRGLNRALLEASFPGSLVARQAALPPVTTPPDPSPDSTTDAAGSPPRKASEQALLIVVLLFGALGGACSATWTTSSFIGGRRMEESWVLWNLLRAPIGAALAAIYYCVVRGGILAGDTPSDKINIFFIAGTGALVGFFAKAAIQKLQQAFGEGGVPEQNSTSGLVAIPVISGVIPTVLPHTAVDSTITLNGKGFPKDPEVQVDGVKQSVVTATPTEIKFTLDPQQKAAPGAKAVIVIAPSKDGEVRSKPSTLTVI